MESFNAFYLQIQDIHVHIFSLKNVKVLLDVSAQRLDEENDPVIVKVESLTATDESSVSNVLASVINNADFDAKWTSEKLEEPSVSYMENSFNIHARDDGNSQANDSVNISDTDCEWKPGPLKQSSDSDELEPLNAHRKVEIHSIDTREKEERKKLTVKTQ